jgi:hypothetical protein
MHRRKFLQSIAALCAAPAVVGKMLAGSPPQNRYAPKFKTPTKEGVVFGTWSDLVIADWNGVDTIVDPYSLKPVH